MLERDHSPGGCYAGLNDEALAALVRAAPAAVLVAMAREAARSQDLRTLQEIARQGHFVSALGTGAEQESANNGAADPHTVAGIDTLFADSEIPLIAALANIVNAPSVGLQPTKTYVGAMRGPTRASEDFKRFFAAQVDQFIDVLEHQRRPASDDPSSEGELSRWLQLKQRAGATMTVLAAAACSMDLQPVLAKLVEHDCYSKAALLRPTILGYPAFRDWRMADSDPQQEKLVYRMVTLKFKPGALAIAFDAHDCYDYLRTRANDDFCPATHAADAYESPDSMGPSVTAAELLEAGVLRVSRPMLAKLVHAGPELETDAEDVHAESLLRLFERVCSEDPRAHCLGQDLIDLGACLRDTWRSGMAAFSASSMDLFARLLPQLDWGEMRPTFGGTWRNLLVSLLERHAGWESQQARDEALARAVAWSHDAGGFAANAATPSGLDAETQARARAYTDYRAFWLACGAGHSLTVIKMLECGYDPHLAVSPHPPVLEQLESRGSHSDDDTSRHMLGLIRSWLARHAAHQAVTDLLGARPAAQRDQKISAPPHKPQAPAA